MAKLKFNARSTDKRPVEPAGLNADNPYYRHGKWHIAALGRRCKVAWKLCGILRHGFSGCPGKFRCGESQHRCWDGYAAAGYPQDPPQGAKRTKGIAMDTAKPFAQAIKDMV